jgi:hypothetical protein
MPRWRLTIVRHSAVAMSGGICVQRAMRRPSESSGRRGAGVQSGGGDFATLTASKSWASGRRCSLRSRAFTLGRCRPRARPCGSLRGAGSGTPLGSNRPDVPLQEPLREHQLRRGCERRDLSPVAQQLEDTATPPGELRPGLVADRHVALPGSRTTRWGGVAVGGCRGDIGPLCYPQDPCVVLKYGASITASVNGRGIRCIARQGYAVLR